MPPINRVYRALVMNRGDRRWTRRGEAYSDIRNQIYQNTLMNCFPNSNLKHTNLILVTFSAIPAHLESYALVVTIELLL